MFSLSIHVEVHTLPIDNIKGLKKKLSWIVIHSLTNVHMQLELSLVIWSATPIKYIALKNMATEMLSESKSIRDNGNKPR